MYVLFNIVVTCDNVTQVSSVTVPCNLYIVAPATICHCVLSQAVNTPTASSVDINSIQLYFQKTSSLF